MKRLAPATLLIVPALFASIASAQPLRPGVYELDTPRDLGSLTVTTLESGESAFVLDAINKLNYREVYLEGVAQDHDGEGLASYVEKDCVIVFEQKRSTIRLTTNRRCATSGVITDRVNVEGPYRLLRAPRRSGSTRKNP